MMPSPNEPPNNNATWPHFNPAGRSKVEREQSSSCASCSPMDNTAMRPSLASPTTSLATELIISNLKSQYAACSANKLIIDKAPDRSMTSNPNDGTTAISNGVVDIKVALAVAPGSDGNIINAVTTKINSVFGVTSPNQLANHVMYCLPSGTMNGIAYAYINSWNSVYSNEWCIVSAQMHEIGHNLGYADSNEGGASYADQAGMMGYSYGQDDGPTMCFNAAKSWQTQWYVSKSTTVHPSAGTCYEGKLYGVADFSNAASTINCGACEDR
ncbi:hypothetical protein ACHAWU_007381 [Discostella pseudostelligera]|uniref:Peptidase M11 gametolysin domain-containing protein n=1 Tax=Discostella pseudostelligera TaxID=259834 RepID=A0ABD3MGY7_9STRA